MRRWFPAARAAAALLASGCLTGHTRTEYDELARAAERPASRPVEGRAAGRDDDEAALAREVRLDRVLRLVHARNPDLAETRARTEAALARVPAAARLPDLELKYEHWGVPLRSPLSLDQAQMLMWGLRQTFPAPGSLDARARAALEDAGSTLEAARARRLDLDAQARRAYAEYFRASTELAVHKEHVRLTAAVVDLARANFRLGRTTQQDVLRTIVELSRIHSDLATVEQELVTSRALLNALMVRPLEAPLGPAAEIEGASPSQDGPPDGAALERVLFEERPELRAAVRIVRRSEANLDRARSEAHWPSFMVGADYWYLPLGTDVKNAWSAMIGINLPWLSPRHRDEVSEAERSVEADRRGLDAARIAARYQLRAALARQEAARQALAVIDRDLVPQAEQSFQATQSAFAAGRADGLGVLDALRTYLQVRLDRARALARLEESRADVDRAVGGGAP